MILEGANLTGITIDAVTPTVTDHWFYSYTGNLGSMTTKIYQDVNKNIYTTAYLPASSPGGRWGFNRISSAGVSQGFYVYSNVGEPVGYRIKSVADSGGNVYMTLPLTTSNNTSFIKSSSNGTLQYTKQIYINNTSRSLIPFDITLDPSQGNVFVVGYADSNETPTDYRVPSIWKIDVSTGLIVWSKTYGGASSNSSYQGYLWESKFDSGGNLWAAGELQRPGDDSSVTAFGVIRVDPISGNIVDQYLFKSTEYFDKARAIAIDHEGNLVIAGSALESGMIIKARSSNGQVLWNKITSAGFDTFQGAIGIDTNNDIYIGGSQSSKIFKFYGSNGAVAWVNKVSYNGDTSPDNCIIDGENLYVGIGANPYRGLVAKLPIDGSGTGTYAGSGNNIIYSANTASFANPTITMTIGNRVAKDLEITVANLNNVNLLSYSNVTITLTAIS